MTTYSSSDDDDDDDGLDSFSSGDDMMENEFNLKKMEKHVIREDELHGNVDDIPCIGEISSGVPYQQPPTNTTLNTYLQQQTMLKGFMMPVAFPASASVASSAGKVTVISSVQELSQIFTCSKSQNKTALYVLVFFRNGCPACEKYKAYQTQNGIHAHYSDVNFVYVDVQNAAVTPYVNQLQIQAVPTFVFMKGCNVVAKLQGFDPSAFAAHVGKFR
ncbi:MAG: thioredoxin family protein [Methylococcales bacterium]|nr:thioredoxin family protein [Methylococcales bacterium]